MIDYMYNLDGDTAEIYTNDDGTCAVFIDRGNPAAGEDVYYYTNDEKAYRALIRAGFEH